MPDRIDRRIEDNRSLLITVFVLVAIAAAVGFYLFGRTSAKPSPPIQEQPNIAVPSADSEEEFVIVLSVPDANGVLSRKEVSLPPRIEAQAQAREALIAALADEAAVRTPVLNRLRFRAFFLDKTGTGYVDLAQAEGGISASAAEELLAVYALVNTLADNFEEVRRVRFLVDGREARTLAGHIDLSQTFTKRADLTKK